MNNVTYTRLETIRCGTKIAFPPTEAASLETLIARQRAAPSLFIGAFLSSISTTSVEAHDRDGKRKLIGFISATYERELTSESMRSPSEGKQKDPAARTVCVHGLVTAAPYRRQGVAIALLKEYIRRLKAHERVDAEEDTEPISTVERVALLCHDELRSLYERAGFICAGPSAVVHGPRPWLEMRVDLNDDQNLPKRTGATLEDVSTIEPNTSVSQTAALSSGVPSGIYEALQVSAASRACPAARLLSTFASIDNVTDDVNADASRRNKYDLLCPRQGCSSTILKATVGKLVEVPSCQIDVVEQVPNALLAPLPSAGTPVCCWLVGPSPMAFENIGFSRPVDMPNTNVDLRNSKRLKLLSCADCDLGPLGWSEEGGHEFWVLCSRVGYLAQDSNTLQ